MVDKSFTHHQLESLSELLQTYLGAENSQIPSADLLIQLKADLCSLQQRAQTRSKDYSKDSLLLAELWKAEEARRMSIKRPAVCENGSQDLPLSKKLKLSSEVKPEPVINGANGNVPLVNLVSLQSPKSAKSTPIKTESKIEVDTDATPDMITESSVESASTPKSVIEQPPSAIAEPPLHSFYKLRPYKERPKPIFDFGNSPDPEALKKYLGVSYYPQVDLSKDLPGVPPMEDFSKAKAVNPVSQQTFQAYIEPYFRQFTEEDLGWLRDRGDQITPYIVPELGPHYTETWNDEDFSRNSPPPSQSNLARGSIELLNDDKLETEDVCLGPLSNRILSALLECDKENAEINPDWRIPNTKVDYPQLEERVKREMRFCGILGEEENIDWTRPEDDEISATLRSLQAQLRRVEKVNASRKSSLETVIRDQMAYQEYSNLLESLEKEIDQSFLKRTRSIKTKKKKPGPGIPRSGVGEGIKCLVERRKKWIATLGPVFQPIEKYTHVPEDGKFTDGEI